MYQLTLNGVSAKISQLSTEMSIKCRLIVNQGVNQVLIEYWLGTDQGLIEGNDQHSPVGAFRAHDPIPVGRSQNFWAVCVTNEHFPKISTKLYVYHHFFPPG